MDLEYKRNLFLLLNAYYSEFTSFFLSGKGSAFLAAATPSPLTTPNSLEKPFKVAVLRTDLTNFIKNYFEFLIKFQIC